MPIDNKRVGVHIWDTAGQERYQAIVSAYYRCAVGAMVFYDMTSSLTFKAVSRWLDELRKNAAPDLVVLLVGNKSDLTDQRAVTREEGMSFAQERNLLFIETSARDATNVREGFAELVGAIVEQYGRTGFDDSGGRGALGPGVSVIGDGPACC